MEVQVTGIAWFKEEEYPQVIELFEDKETLPGTYQEWVSKAETILKALEGQGRKVIKAYIDPKEFPRWCMENGKRLNGQARMDYASFCAFKSAKVQ